MVASYLQNQQNKTKEFIKNNHPRTYINSIIQQIAKEAKINHDGDISAYIAKHLDIITFNYDCLAETLIEHSYNVDVSYNSSDQISENKVNILHVYGKLMNDSKCFIHKLPEFINGLLEEYEYSSINLQWLFNTKIDWVRYGRSKEDKTLKSSCSDLISKADNIYFLGFGFDKNNLEVIGFTGEHYFDCYFKSQCKQELDEQEINDSDLDQIKQRNPEIINKYFGYINQYQQWSNSIFKGNDWRIPLESCCIPLKKIYISKANGVIIETLLQVTDSIARELKISQPQYEFAGKVHENPVRSRHGAQDVFISQDIASGSKIVYSYKSINEAFAEDFDI
jgi:hypothetical protein